MKLSDSIKTFFAWLGVLASIPGVILMVRTTGVVQLAAGASLVLLVACVWHWRRLLDYVINIETVHSFSVLNDEGDVLYERHESLLPLLFPIKTHEVFVSLSGEQAQIEYVRANCSIDWDSKETKTWHGIAKVPKHVPALAGFGRNVGVRVEWESLWKRAVIDPPHDFVVACGTKRASRIIMKARWPNSAVPIEVTGQMAPFPSELLVKKKMVDTTTIPWMNQDGGVSKVEADGSLSFGWRIDHPKRHCLYRILWMPRSRAVRSEV